MSFTWYMALQGEYIRTFLPVYVSREAKFRHDLESPLAQGDAVLCPKTHVSPVKPLHAGGARRAVHLSTYLCAAECSLSAGDSREARCVLIHIQCATRDDWPGARSLRCNYGQRGAAVHPSLCPIAMRVSLLSCQSVGVVTGLLVLVTTRDCCRPVCVCVCVSLPFFQHVLVLQTLFLRTLNRFCTCDPEECIEEEK